MTGLKLRVPSKAQLAGLAWAVALRVLMVLYAAWFVDLLMGTPPNPAVPYAAAIAAVVLVDIVLWMSRWVRANRRA